MRLPSGSFVVTLAALLVGCGAGRSAVDISLEGQARGVTSLEITVDNGGKTSLPVTYTLGAAVDIPPAKTLALQFDSSRTGAITVHVEARGASGVVATGSGTGTVTPGKLSSTISVTLTPTSEQLPDLMAVASDASVDMTTSPDDLATQPDLTGGGPTLRGGFVSGGGTVTEGAVTLTGHFYWQGATMTATSGAVTLTGWFQ